MLWTRKAEPSVAAPVFDYAKCEVALMSTLQVQRSPFLVRSGGKWRPLHDGELARFVRLYLEEIGRTDLFDIRLVENFLAFLKAGL